MKAKKFGNKSKISASKKCRLREPQFKILSEIFLSISFPRTTLQECFTFPLFHLIYPAPILLFASFSLSILIVFMGVAY